MTIGNSKYPIGHRLSKEPNSTTYQFALNVEGIDIPNPYPEISAVRNEDKSITVTIDHACTAVVSFLHQYCVLGTAVDKAAITQATLPTINGDGTVTFTIWLQDVNDNSIVDTDDYFMIEITFRDSNYYYTSDV